MPMISRDTFQHPTPLRSRVLRSGNRAGRFPHCFFKKIFGAGALNEPPSHSRLTAIGRAVRMETVPFPRPGRLAGLPRNTCRARTYEAGGALRRFFSLGRAKRAKLERVFFTSP